MKPPSPLLTGEHASPAATRAFWAETVERALQVAMSVAAPAVAIGTISHNLDGRLVTFQAIGAAAVSLLVSIVFRVLPFGDPGAPSVVRRAARVFHVHWAPPVQSGHDEPGTDHSP